jgi:hypothetical protein
VFNQQPTEREYQMANQNQGGQHGNPDQQTQKPGQGGQQGSQQGNPGQQTQKPGQGGQQGGKDNPGQQNQR